MRHAVQVLSGAAIALLAMIGAPAADDRAASLRASFAQLEPELERSPFGAPVHLVSTETGRRLEGDVHAIVDQPFDAVRSGLGTARNWCDILILHPNVTSCHLRQAPNPRGDDPTLLVEIGRQHTPVEFQYRVAATGADFLDVQLGADVGPLGTRDYRIELEATPRDPGHTYLRLLFSHTYGLQAQVAMSAYLRTLGRGKVGFSVVGHDAGGHAVYVGGLRGALERNAMRYYVCAAAYLESLGAAPSERFEAQLRRWYRYAERYSPQLHEDPDYLDLKRKLAATR